MSLSSALLKKSGPPPALPPRPGAAGASPSGGGGASLGLGPTSISGGFGSNGSSGTGGFGSNGGSSASGSNPRAYGGGGGGGVWGGGGGVTGPAYPPLPLRAGVGAGAATAVAAAGAGGKGGGKQAPALAHCFELHSGKLLGDKRNREGRLYFKVLHTTRRCVLLCVCLVATAGVAFGLRAVCVHVRLRMYIPLVSSRA